MTNKMIEEHNAMVEKFMNNATENNESYDEKNMCFVWARAAALYITGNDAERIDSNNKIVER